MSDPIFLLVFAFLIGLCVGSFLNVMGLRLLSEESLVYPSSHCPHCKVPLRWYDNIPVLSYLALGGQCRQCKATISIQYPLIELATGVLFAYTVWQFGIEWQTLFLLFLIANLVVIFITDLRESLIYHVNSLSLVPAGLLYNFLNLGGGQGGIPVDLAYVQFTIPGDFISAIIAVLGAILIFEGMILLSQLAFGTEGFGHGDTHLMMGVGAFLGWELGLLALFLGFIIQTIPAIPMLVYGWIQNKQYVSLASGGCGVLFGLLPLVLVNLDLSPALISGLSLGAMILSLVALFVFLRQVKHSQSFTYLPLGPALVIGSLIALFWGDPILRSFWG